MGHGRAPTELDIEALALGHQGVNVVAFGRAAGREDPGSPLAAHEDRVEHAGHPDALEDDATRQFEQPHHVPNRSRASHRRARATTRRATARPGRRRRRHPVYGPSRDRDATKSTATIGATPRPLEEAITESPMAPQPMTSGTPVHLMSARWTYDQPTEIASAIGDEFARQVGRHHLGHPL